MICAQHGRQKIPLRTLLRSRNAALQEAIAAGDSPLVSGALDMHYSTERLLLSLPCANTDDAAAKLITVVQACAEGRLPNMVDVMATLRDAIAAFGMGSIDGALPENAPSWAESVKRIEGLRQACENADADSADIVSDVYFAAQDDFLVNVSAPTGEALAYKLEMAGAREIEMPEEWIAAFAADARRLDQRIEATHA